jgi:predicted enzyme related to lactoylglutathione lyase
MKAAIQGAPPGGTIEMAARIIHVEVTGDDGAALQRFYGDVFGWTFDTNNPGGYGLVRQGEMTGGIGSVAEGQSGRVTFYVHADDPEGTLKRVTELGGRVLMPLTEVAPETNVALFADPEGHIVGLM